MISFMISTKRSVIEPCRLVTGVPQGLLLAPLHFTQTRTLIAASVYQSRYADDMLVFLSPPGKLSQLLRPLETACGEKNVSFLLNKHKPHHSKGPVIALLSSQAFRCPGLKVVN